MCQQSWDRMLTGWWHLLYSYASERSEWAWNFCILQSENSHFSEWSVGIYVFRGTCSMLTSQLILINIIKCADNPRTHAERLMTFNVVMRANGVSELEILLHFSIRKELFPACWGAYDIYASERSEFCNFQSEKSHFLQAHGLMTFIVVMQRNGVSELEFFFFFAFFSPKRAISRMLTGWWPFFFSFFFCDPLLLMTLSERTEWASLNFFFAFFSPKRAISRLLTGW